MHSSSAPHLGLCVFSSMHPNQAIDRSPDKPGLGCGKEPLVHVLGGFDAVVGVKEAAFGSLTIPGPPRPQKKKCHRRNTATFLPPFFVSYSFPTLYALTSWLFSAWAGSAESQEECSKPMSPGPAGTKITDQGRTNSHNQNHRPEHSQPANRKINKRESRKQKNWRPTSKTTSQSGRALLHVSSSRGPCRKTQSPNLENKHTMTTKPCQEVVFLGSGAETIVREAPKKKLNQRLGKTASTGHSWTKKKNSLLSWYVGPGSQ